LALTVVIVTGITALLIFTSPERQPLPEYNVAFIGNSIMYTYDLPRLMEMMAATTTDFDDSADDAEDDDRSKHFHDMIHSKNSAVYTDSCLHGSLNLKTQLTTGNGMYMIFDSANAVIDAYDYYDGDKDNDDAGNGNNNGNGENDDDNVEYSTTVVDYGACTVPQLLFGRDDHLDEDDGYYNDDGKNPCFQDENYLEFLQTVKYKDAYNYNNNHNEKDGGYGYPPRWDFVVMNDRTVFPGIVKKRSAIIETLKDQYAPMLASTRGSPRPVLLATYGYDRPQGNSKWKKQLNSGGDDGDDENLIVEFTSHVHRGYVLYAQALAETLPENQAPLIAPVGLAFLTIYEEDRAMWNKLFYYDRLHPSPHGSYVIGLVVFATIYNRMPPKRMVLQQDMSWLWSRARRYQVTSNGPAMVYPNVVEAEYLYDVCRRVALSKRVPDSLLSAAQIAQLEQPYYDELRGDFDDDAFYTYDDDDCYDDDPENYYDEYNNNYN